MNKKNTKKWIMVITTIIIFVIINIVITYLFSKYDPNPEPNPHYIRGSSIPKDTPKP